jgi:hypothetical protein
MRRLLAGTVSSLVLGFALVACQPLGGGQREAGTTGTMVPPSSDDGRDGVAWGQHAFSSNGERIYFTSSSERGTKIESVGGPAGSSWMMMHGRLACVSCHGVDGRGGRRGMMAMEAKDIRWSTLSREFDEAQFARLVREGIERDGVPLSSEMPRWRMGDDDMADLVAFLKTLR